MKTLTPSSSVKSSTTIITMEESQNEPRDSCYYPGCGKDANCNCEICLISINATLDLMPYSIQKSKLSKLSASQPDDGQSTPIFFDASIVSTPRSNSCERMKSPDLKSTLRLSVKGLKKRETNIEFHFWGVVSKLALVLSLVFAVEFGLVSMVFRPELSPNITRGIGERSWVVSVLNGRLKFLQNELQGIVHSKISNCSCSDSKWEVNRDVLLNSRCVLYKSTMDEVSIWGWPLQTAGSLTTGFSSRSFTILSGRVTEFGFSKWSNGKAGFSIRKVNTSWVHKKWGACVMQLNPNTWILEYRRSSILESSRLSSVAFELLKYRMAIAVSTLNEELWQFSAFQNQYRAFMAKEYIKRPT